MKLSELVNLREYAPDDQGEYLQIGENSERASMIIDDLVKLIDILVSELDEVKKYSSNYEVTLGNKPPSYLHKVLSGGKVKRFLKKLQDDFDTQY